MRVKYFTDGVGGQRAGLTFYCLACQQRHVVGLGWQFNGNLDKPSFTPSVVVRLGHYLTGDATTCHCAWSRRFPRQGPEPRPCVLCHSVITDGMITYTSDCSHAFKNRTIPLPELPRSTP